MKKELFDQLKELMKLNPEIYLLFGDLGWPRVDEFLKEFPDRAFNCGASEQTMLDMAVGLAYSGKIPVCYTITPFLLRGWETIRTYIDHENLNVKLIGVGVNGDYSEHGDGFSHDARDIKDHFQIMTGFETLYPKRVETLQRDLVYGLGIKGPVFINIKR